MNTTLSIRQRFDNFSKRIKPTEEHFKEATRQADYMIERLHGIVSDDHCYELSKVLKAGSNAKHTSLLKTDENAFDIDLGAYYNGEGAKKHDLDRLLTFTHKCLREIYPQKDKNDFIILKSAVRVIFNSGIQLWVDVAPIVADPDLKVDNGGWIPRSDGEWRLTSVTAHNDFIATRTAASKKRAGPVHFNRLVRMVKWWNNLQGGLTQPSIFCELLAAAAVEAMGGVTPEWQTTLRGVFEYIVRNRFATPIIFDDYYVARNVQVPGDTVVILDSVNATNNITANWTKSTREAYVAIAEEALDAALQARSAELDDELDDAVELWSEIFGEKFLELSEPAK